MRFAWNQLGVQDLMQMLSENKNERKRMTSSKDILKREKTRARR